VESTHACKGLRCFGRQDGSVDIVAVNCQHVDLTDGSSKKASPVRPILIMARRYSDPVLSKEISSYQLARFGHFGHGVTTGYAER